VEETTMTRNARSDSRLASTFAALVCAWVVGLVFAGLAAARSVDDACTPSAAVAAAEYRR
jgi:hypothetical protein